MPPALAAAARAAAAPAGQPVVADPLIAPQPVPVAAGGALPFVIPAHPDADSVAAKLQRIRAVVGQGTMPFVAQDFAEDLGETPPQPLAGLDAGALGDSAASQSLSTQWDDLGEAADERAAAAQTATNAEPAPDDAEHQAAGDDSSFDLAGLTAALGAEVPQEGVVAPKPELAPELAPIRARVIRVRRADADAAPIAAVVAEALATADTPAADAPAADTPTAGPSGGESDELPDLDALGDLMAMDGLQDDAALDAILAQDAEEIGFDDLPAAPATDPATDIDFDDATLGDGTLPPEAEADLIRELAALEREAIPAAAALIEPVKDVVDDTFSLTQIMAAAARDADEKARDTDAFAALLNAPPGDDAVFDFSAMANEDPTEAAEVTADITPNLRLGRDLLEREPEADAEAMERILSQTDAALNAPETSRRREAIAQLKAAVAATEAARMLGETAPEPELDEVENAFRDDLKQVVRPRRPVGEVSPEQRSERPRPAPLKLVASQRIDIPRPGLAPKPVSPVRPRRVMVQDDEPGSAPVVLRNPASSFAEFAANMGATELPDLLEAAAAYTAFVEGVEDFSRPQLMKKVQDMGEADFSREDGLRSFGTLLRQGRIMKTSNGRFVVNEESRFNPERKTG